MKSGDREVLAASDPAYFAREYAVTMRSAEEGVSEERFPVYPYLIPFFAAFENRENILWEKSRQMMGSWAVMIAFLWSILFRRNRTFSVVSEKEELVDDRAHTHNSLLGKIHVLARHLPPFMTRHLSIKRMVIHNGGPFNSTIKGETANPNATRSASLFGCLLDEASHMEYGEEIHTAAVRSCPWGRILLSTPNPEKDVGEDVFSRLRWSPNSAGYTVLTTHWRDHPEYTQEWYERECEQLTPRQIAAELDIKYGRDISGRCFYAWDRNDFASVKFDRVPGEKVYRTWDFGVGTCAVLLSHVRTVHTKAGNALSQIRVFDYVEDSGKPARYYRNLFEGQVSRYEKHTRVFDEGDPYMLDQRDSNLTSWFINLSQADPDAPYSIVVSPVDCVGVSIPNLIENTCKFMRTVELEDGTREPLLMVSSHLTRVIECVENYHYPTNRKGEVMSDKPVKDQYSHIADDLQYRAWTVSPMKDLRGDDLGPSSVKTSGVPSIVRELGDIGSAEDELF